MIVQNSLLHAVCMLVVLLGAASWLPFAILQHSAPWSARIACFIVGVLAIYVILDRETYLPFLGEAVIPSTLINGDSNNVDIGKSKNVLVKLRNLPPSTKLIYWGARPAKTDSSEVKYWKDAYGAYENSGVVITSADGMASFSISCPQSYYVRVLGLFQKQIPAHIHFRYVLPGSSGTMLSEVKTVPILC